MMNRRVICVKRKWRPMRTAPRDGTPVLLLAGSGEWPFIGHWGTPTRYVTNERAWIGHEWGLHQDRNLIGWLPLPVAGDA